MIKPIWIACLWGLVLSQQCNAQLTVNGDWRERNGLTVASSQTVLVHASKLRGFTTIESADAEPRTAVSQVKEKKKSAMAALQTIGVPEKAAKITSTKIAEWNATQKGPVSYQSNTISLSPRMDSSDCTAVAHLSFDIPVTGMDSDDLTVLPHELSKRLQTQPVFESSKFVWIYVGEVDSAQVKDANKRAYAEALANAKSLASLSGRSLGKLVSLTPEVNGRWRYMSELTYGPWSDEAFRKSPTSNFSPSEDEVFGNDPSNLSRTFSIELRFSIE